MSDTTPNPAFVALVKAAMEMPNPGKDSENGAYKQGGKAHELAAEVRVRRVERDVSDLGLCRYERGADVLAV